MKKILFLAFFFLMLTHLAYSQKNKRDQIKALKTAYITEKLELSSSEAEKFWPIYNSYSKKNRQLRQAMYKILMQNNKITLDANQANEKLEQLTTIEKQQYENKINLINHLKKVISPKKIVQLFAAEKSFNRKLLKKLRHQN